MVTKQYRDKMIREMLMHENIRYLPGGRRKERRPPIENGYDVNVFIVYGSNNKYLIDNEWVHDEAPVHIPTLRSRNMMEYDNGDYNVFNKVHIPLQDLTEFQRGITSHNNYLHHLSKNDKYALITILAWTWHGNVLLEHLMNLQSETSYDPAFCHMHVKSGSTIKCTLDENGFPREADFYLHTSRNITYVVCEGQLRKVTNDYTSTPHTLIQNVCDTDPTQRLDIWVKTLIAWRSDIQSIILKAPRLDQDIYLYHGTVHGVDYMSYFHNHIQAFSLCPCCALLYSRQKHKNEIHVIYRMKVPAGSPLLMFPGVHLAIQDYTYCEVFIPQDMSIQEENQQYIDYDRGIDSKGKPKGIGQCQIIDVTLQNPKKL